MSKGRRIAEKRARSRHVYEIGRKVDAVSPKFLAFRDQRVFGSLNGLRAIAVIAVVWQHTGTGGGLLGKGYYGVDFFFAISGFLITTLLLREHSRRGQIDLRAFFARRSLRIFPLYYATLGLYVLLAAATQRHTAKGHEFFEHLPAFLTYTSNWFVEQDGQGTTFYFAWSLATEEQYYLVWAPLLFAALTFVPKGMQLAASSLVALAVIDVAASTQHSLLATILSSPATPILAASLLAIALHTRRGFSVAGVVLRQRWTLAASLAAILGLLATGLDNRMVVGALMAVAVAAMSVREDHFLRPALEWRPLAYVGTISYGVYLLHMLASNALRPVAGGKGPVLFAVTLAGAIGLATLSFRYFETPFLQRKRRFERGVHGQVEAVPA